MTRDVKITTVNEIDLSNNLPFAVFGGMNVIESYDVCIKVAESFKNVCEDLEIPFIFKASFDKANRSHATGERGLGFVIGTGMIRDVAEKADVKTCVDFHDVFINRIWTE